MPWSPKQHALFCMMASNSKKAAQLRKTHGVSQEKAKKMCREGIK